MIFRHAALLGLACLLANPAFAGHSARTSSEKPLVRLARPAGRPLNGDEIRAALSGYKLVLDEHYIQANDVQLRVTMLGGCPPVETFLADERWEQTICGIMLTVKRGAWRIKGSTVCVRSNISDEECRTVWRTGAPDRLILTVPMLSGEYNPYRLVPLSNDR